MKPIKNNCIHYEPITPGTYPDSFWSCRGCIHSFDPALYDAGCKLPIEQREKQSTGQLPAFSRKRAIRNTSGFRCSSHSARVLTLIRRPVSDPMDFLCGHTPYPEGPDLRE